VLDELDTFFEGGNLNLSFVIIISPLGVFNLSLFGSLVDGIDGLIVVLLGLSEVNLSLFEDGTVVGDGGFEGSDGGYVLGDLLVESTDGFVTHGLVGLVVGVMFSLILLELSGDFVKEEGDFFLGGIGGKV